MEDVGPQLLPPAQQPHPQLSTGRSLNHQTAAFDPKSKRERKKSKQRAGGIWGGRAQLTPVTLPSLLQPLGLSLSSAWLSPPLTPCPCGHRALRPLPEAQGTLRARCPGDIVPARCCDSDQQPEQARAPTTPESGVTTGRRRSRDSSKATGRARCHRHRGDSAVTGGRGVVAAVPPLPAGTAVTNGRAHGNSRQAGFSRGLGRKDKGGR